jgi:hypothetical protein
MGAPVRAQSGTPAATTGVFPAGIYNGLCRALGTRAWSLNDVSNPGLPVTVMGTPAPGTPVANTAVAGTPITTASATPSTGMVVAASSTTVKVNLADLEKAAFAVRLQKSVADNTTVECGDITGAITGGSLTVQLSEVNKSGFSGTAVFHDNGDGTTTIAIQLIPAKSTGTSAG